MDNILDDLNQMTTEQLREEFRRIAEMVAPELTRVDLEYFLVVLGGRLVTAEAKTAPRARQS